MLQSEVNLLRCHWSQAGLRCTQVCLSGLSSPTHTRSLTIHPSPTSSRPDTTHTHARMHARIHGCTDACTHTHSHTHACMHTHTHPHTPSTFYPSRLVANQIQRVSALHFTHTHTLFLSRSLSLSLSLSLYILPITSCRRTKFSTHLHTLPPHVFLLAGQRTCTLFSAAETDQPFTLIGPKLTRTILPHLHCFTPRGLRG